MANRDLNTLYCANCGSSDVEMTMWVNPNTGERSSWSSNRFEEGDCWCKHCQEHVELLILKELWDQFSVVPVNNDDDIEEDFLFFPAGTSKFEVWHWFDDRCPNNLHDDLLNLSDD